MKRDVLFFIFILFTTKVFCCDVVLEIDEHKTYYKETVVSTQNPINLIIKSNKVKIKGIGLLDSSLFVVEKIKNTNKKAIFTITKKKNTLEKRLKVEIEDTKGNKYFLTLLFYSTKYNIDEMSKTFNIQYNKSKNYPILLTSNSHVMGNYYIFDDLGNQVFEFEMLFSFSILIDSLKEGDYYICENNIDNPLFSLTIDDK